MNALIAIRKWWCVLTAIAAVLSSAAARADAAQDAKKAIQALYDSTNTATSKRDVTNMFAIYSSSFVAENAKGKRHTLADLKREAQLMLNQARIITGTTKVQSIVLKGATAVVRITEHSKMIGTDPQTRTDATIIIDSTSDDVWVLTNTHWLLTKSKTRTAKSTLNGRPFE